MSLNDSLIWAKAASRVVSTYFRRSPVQRGKHWLFRRSSSFLLASVAPGLWVRVTGASGFEWKALSGQRCEPVTVNFFQSLLKSDTVVFDVGANIGFYSLLASLAVGDGGQVHAFEATPAVAERITDNIKINRLTNVRVNNSAVCDHSGVVEFHIQPDDSEGNSLVSYSPGWPAVPVLATTLDEYVEKHQIERVHLIKIDTEGAEPLVLAGASRLLAGPNPPTMIIEINPPALQSAGSSAGAIFGRLSGLGYECLGLEQLTFTPEPVWNVLAVHPSDAAACALARQHGLTPFRGN